MNANSAVNGERKWKIVAPFDPKSAAFVGSWNSVRHGSLNSSSADDDTSENNKALDQRQLH